MGAYYLGLVFVCGLFGSMCFFKTEYIWEKILKKQSKMGTQRLIIQIVGVFLIISACVNLLKLIKVF